MQPEMVFLLASPRSGSTLLRVMLAGHPQLFSPPELNLLPFCSMAERERRIRSIAAYVVPCDLRVGLTEAVMHLRGEDAEGSESWLRSWVARDIPVEEMYRMLRELATPRRLVDKSTLNASCAAFLEKTRWLSPAAHFIHLVRHPYAVIESLQRNYLQHVPQLAAFRMAEDLWTSPNVNVLRFLRGVPFGRQLFVRFEELVRDPDAVMRRICSFLNLPFDPAVLSPYEGGRMTEGSPGRFESLGDPSFHDHDRIEARLGEVWRTMEMECELSPASRELALYMQYELPGRRARGQPLQSGNGEVLLVVPPYTYRAQDYVRAARKLGFTPVCALDPSYGVPEEVDSYLPISFEQPACSAQTVAAYAQSRPVRGILSVDDMAAPVAALTSGLLGLPHNPVEAFSATRDKHMMRVLFHRAGVPAPKFVVHNASEDPNEIAARLRYPVVLKPLHLTGGRGVIRADRPEDFIVAFARVARLLDQPGTGSGPNRLLVEEYIPGAEFCVDGILTDGRLRVLAIYDKPDPKEGPFFEETILTTPSRYPRDVQAQLVACAQRATRAIGLSTGPVNVELRVNEQGPWMLELAARAMGGYCSRALPFKAGRTLEELVLSQATGLPIDDFDPAPGAHGVMMIPIPGEGIYRGTKGTAEAEAMPGICGVMVTMPIGGMVTPPPEGDKYMGFIFANGDSPSFVENALRKAHSRLTFELDPVMKVRLRIGPTTRPCANLLIP
jgi:biotin carboxylase